MTQHTYIFLADTDADPIFFTECLKDFYKDMLGDHLENIDESFLEQALSEMEVFVDMDENRAILVYETNEFT